MTTKLIGFDEKEFKQEMEELANAYESAIRDAEGRSQDSPFSDKGDKTKPVRSIQGLTEEQWRQSEDYYGM